MKWLDEVDEDKPLTLLVNYDTVSNDEVELPTSLHRELAYNIEHAIHHLAIIRVAKEKEYPLIKSDKHFGVAYSTIRFRDGLCAR